MVIIQVANRRSYILDTFYNRLLKTFSITRT